MIPLNLTKLLWYAFYYETWLATKRKPVDFYISSQEQGEQQKICNSKWQHLFIIAIYLNLWLALQQLRND